MHPFPNSVSSPAIEPSNLRQLLQAQSEAWSGLLEQLRHQEQRVVVGGIALALALLVMLAMVLSGSVDQARQKRLAEGELTLQRGLCGSMADRRERESCLRAVMAPVQR